MKKLLVLIIVFLQFNLLSQRSWIVDSNPGNTAKDFSNLNSAVQSASVLSGDTLYLLPSAINYGNVSSPYINKKLIIIGPGYFLSENNDLQATSSTANVGHLYFAAGSEGSIVMGVTIETSYCLIATSNITVRRNRFLYNGTQLQIYSTVLSNILISQNYFYTNYYYYNIEVQANSSNIIISNNYIHQQFATSPHAIYVNATNTTVNIVNNVIYGNVTIGDQGSFNNNILRSGTFTAPNITAFNNIGSGTQFGTSNGNQENVDMGTVFVGSGTTDSKWKLAVSSPALGAGLSGEDCGMYGGSSPYVLSGIPPIPSIFFFSAPISGSKTQGLQIRIKARSNN